MPLLVLTPMSPRRLFILQSLWVYQNAFYVKKGSSWKYTNAESFKQIRLGLIDGYGYYPELDSYIETYKGNKLFKATGDDALPKLIKMLKAGRLDAIIDNVNVMSSIIQNEKLENTIVSAGVVDHKSDLFMAFTPAKDSSKDYAKIFDAGLVELRNSGKLQEILAKYGLKDWK